VANELRIVQVRKTKTLRYYIRVAWYALGHKTENGYGEGRTWKTLNGPLIDHVIVLNYVYSYISPTIWNWTYKLNGLQLEDYNITDYLLQINNLPKVIWTLILDFVWSYSFVKRIVWTYDKLQ
jgi:hypothetical protein